MIKLWFSTMHYCSLIYMIQYRNLVIAYYPSFDIGRCHDRLIQGSMDQSELCFSGRNFALQRIKRKQCQYGVTKVTLDKPDHSRPFAITIMAVLE